MNILAVQIFSQTRPQKRLSLPVRGKTVMDAQTNSAKYGEIDYYPYSTVKIPFTGKFSDAYPKYWLKNLLKLNLPCPCCGKTMIPLDKIKELPAAGLFSASCLTAINALEQYEDIMKPVEYSIMQIIKPLAQKYPGIDLQELIVLLSFEYESNLVATQLTILNRLKSMIPELEKEHQQELYDITQTAKEFIVKKRMVKFKRKIFIKDVEEFADKIKDKELSEKIKYEAEQMPTSEDSVSAFIMKYKDRTPEEIGERLLMFSAATLEHITPDSQNGEVTIWECQRCNNNRSDRPIVEQITQNPNMLDNLRNHIGILVDRAIFLRNHGGNEQANKLFGYAKAVRDEYLTNIKKAKEDSIKVEQEALIKLQFDEIPIPPDYIEE